jgi:hypothetical protein
MRLLVQDPMKTASTGMSFIGVPGSSAMYSSARSAAARWCSSAIKDGSGTVSESETP